MRELTNVLERELSETETLHFRLLELNLLLKAGEGAYLRRASHEVDSALSAVRDVAFMRELVVSQVAEELRCPTGTTLDDLVLLAPAPAQSACTRSRSALGRMLEAVDQLSAQTKQLADATTIELRRLTEEGDE